MAKEKKYSNGKYLSIVVTLYLLSIIPANSIQLGSYDHNSRQAFLIEESYMNAKLSDNNRLIFVDFDKKTIEVIVESGKLSRLSVNGDKKFLAYTDKDKFYVYDIKNRNNIKEYDGIYDQVTWGPNGSGYLAGHNISNNQLFITNIHEDSTKIVQNPGKSFWGVRWDTTCKCFYFEISQFPHTQHTLGMIDNKEFVEKNNTINSTLKSPYGNYFLESNESKYDDAYNEIKIKKVDTKSNEQYERAYLTAIPIKSSNLLWSNDKLRIMDAHALINLNTGNLVYPSRYIFQSTNNAKPQRIKYIDIAADKSGYVLMWDVLAKKFVVEDINSGKIIASHDKFW